ncbi:hypothetical protein GCM10007421_18820 [Halopseudomonas oceani]|uniref:Uncharacterized protein n=2 Tax=Pseudomonadaceae TaxID=135621 RepID=A0A2P4EVP9_9GAMM|nr:MULTISPECIES: hypothetical protein [Halopseudomonas]POB03649.1 hypothetical protein C1949_09775 [Halopseudomonas oceani]GGE44885.1 hypothetical protein GCM10007421_18820 [Halopseudomonas oceani]
MTTEQKREYPEEYEFVGFFECEPQMTDSDVPWCYNTAAYTTVRNGLRVECTISPGYGDMDLLVLNGEEQLVRLSVNHIQKIEFEATAESEKMIVEFNEGTILHPLILQLKPTVNVSWGTEQQ